MKSDLKEIVEKFVVATIVSNPKYHFYFDNTESESQFCVEVKRGGSLVVELPDGAYHRSGEGIFIKDENGDVHTLLRFRYIN